MIFILFKNVENNEGKLDVQILAEVDSVLKLIRIDNEVIIDKINLNHRISFQPIAFKQIIQNLISNAIKYNDKAVTKITITYPKKKNNLDKR
jgi:signal transduction histidine kinase